jgi:transcriptional regulator with XRE-family HTH domain
MIGKINSVMVGSLPPYFMNIECKITLGRLIRNVRKSLGISQRELCQNLSKYDVQINYLQLSKIENDRIDVCDSNYDSLIHALCHALEGATNKLKRLLNKHHSPYTLLIKWHLIANQCHHF